MTDEIVNVADFDLEAADNLKIGDKLTVCFDNCTVQTEVIEIRDS